MSCKLYKLTLVRRQNPTTLDASAKSELQKVFKSCRQISDLKTHLQNSSVLRQRLPLHAYFFVGQTYSTNKDAKILLDAIAQKKVYY